MERLHRVVGPIATNVHVLADPRTREAIAIDTATPSLAWIADELAARDWTLRFIVSTHGHWDHIGDNAAVAEHTGAEIAVHAARSRAPDRPAAAVGAVRDRPRPCRPWSWPRAGSSGSAISAFAFSTRRVIPKARSACSPRTTASSTAATRYSRAGGGGLTSPGGDPAAMAASIARLSELEDHVSVFPGHGAATTIGRERGWLELVRSGGRLFARATSTPTAIDWGSTDRCGSISRRSPPCIGRTCRPSRSRTPASSSAKPIELDPTRFVRKLGVERRGGICYELNGAFAVLLRSIGFEVDLLEARGHETEGRLGPRFDHLALRVTLDEPWLVDVGFGYSFVEPLRLAHRPRTGRPHGRVPTGGRRRRTGPRMAPPRRTLGPALPAGPGPPRAGRVRRDSPVPPDRSRVTVHARLDCVVLAPDGARTLSGRHYIATDGSSRDERDLTDDETTGVLASAFGIRAALVDGRWIRADPSSGLRRRPARARRHGRRRSTAGASRIRAARTGRARRSGSASPRRASPRSYPRP